ncbi:hypothetical protein EJ05DRAFT_515628 [Pseudovirgaria hyperparasitica]|uniref:Uncharacterized protein n=1 Tax=Pseudovirgaria hyperparasitica TaxID=470096 RepID=A0A6A6VQR0_9PEZI|nr:uncharacterized protein EJ05DRAFT_515628 [Pseudovirgaria hyperparasitica]KAF2752465.1 hypothetical protein EJ05DRAFT_515628 [Pseudovirgaria hyperparasitica]
MSVDRAEPIMQQNLPTTSSSCTPFATAHPISPPLITATRGTYTCYIEFPDIVEDFSRAWKPLASIIPHFLSLSRLWKDYRLIRFCSNACVRQEFTSPNTVLKFAQPTELPRALIRHEINLLPQIRE